MADDLEGLAAVDDRQRRPVAAERPVGDADAGEAEERLVGGMQQGPDVALGLAAANPAGELGRLGQADGIGLRGSGSSTSASAAGGDVEGREVERIGGKRRTHEAAGGQVDCGQRAPPDGEHKKLRVREP